MVNKSLSVVVVGGGGVVVNVVVLDSTIEFLWWVGWGLQSHFHVKPYYS